MVKSNKLCYISNMNSYSANALRKKKVVLHCADIEIAPKYINSKAQNSTYRRTILHKF